MRKTDKENQPKTPKEIVREIVSTCYDSKVRNGIYLHCNWDWNYSDENIEEGVKITPITIDDLAKEMGIPPKYDDDGNEYFEFIFN